MDEPTSAEWVIGEWVTLDRELHPFEALELAADGPTWALGRSTQTCDAVRGKEPEARLSAAPGGGASATCRRHGERTSRST